MRTRPVTLLLAATLVALAGCADLDRPGGGAPAGDAADPTDGAVHREPPLLQVRRSGGFVPWGWDFATVPELTVYAGGQAVTHGPQIEIFPPPALPNLLTTDLDGDDVRALVAAARDAGLLGETPDYGHPPVADAPTTFVTLRVDGVTVEHAAEALGLAGEEGGAVAAGPGAGEPLADEAGPDDGVLSGLSPEQRRARVALADFIIHAHGVVGSVGGEEPYDVPGFAVAALPAPQEEAPAEESPEGSLPVEEPVAPVLDWPLDLPLAQARECALVTGEEARALRDVLVGTVRTARFHQDGVRYDVAVRPLLPHERTCADL